MSRSITIQPIRMDAMPYEANLSYNGSSYHLLFGRHSFGWFLCIPNHRIGVELAEPSDFFWNRANLQHTGVPAGEAKAIADALKELSLYI